ncbi:unnamed protein product [Caenorhabditis bovis]|uniref:IMD domain-containing protein n=1 Tax=Caenorhabditis bovis TaxID=2654633 RepID=A0A8S1F0F4_9PELO|nr:unnamed protein product [Caenorhabditis bovis]
MDPDAEFNLLTTLYQSVVHDMKHTYPGWEQLSQKAVKLGAQLKATAQCLAAFVEAMQAVCDHANNLKGASRDVGACVTRVCIKQRAIENRMRSWAEALCDEFAVSLQQRCNYWKSRCGELDKIGSKHVKKVRSRKQRPDITAMSEQREICSRVLTEQRTQFSFFIGTLMPVLNAQMSMLDEGAHLRQVVENLDSTVKHVDTDQLVNSIVTDVAQGPDSAWKQCLAQAGQKWRSADEQSSCAGSVRDLSTRATTPASNFSSEDGMSTLTARRSNGEMIGRKPPLQRRNSEKSIGQFSMSSPNTDGSSTYLNLVGNASSNTITEQSYHANASRVNSNASNGHPTGPPPAYQHVITQRQVGMQRPSNFGCDFNMSAYAMNTSTSMGGTPICQQPGSSCGSESASSSALLIAEACKEIDQLGSDLENYCAMSASDTATRYFVSSPPKNGVTRRGSHVDEATYYDPMKRVSMGPPTGVVGGAQNPTNGGVRMRTTSASRPPPPARRSSQITAATPTAPSVAEQRMNGGSIMGSRQSLDSAGIYDQQYMIYNQNMSSFGRNSTTSNPPAAAKFRI